MPNNQAPTGLLLAQAVISLERGSTIESMSALTLQFPADHPQGLVRSDGRWWMSTVDTDRVEGHLLGFDDDGILSADIVLLDGPRFHPGGIDVSAGVIVVPVAEYRPDSTTALIRVDLASESAELVGRVEDHIGALASPRPEGTTTAMTWGSRQVLTLDADGSVVEQSPNPSHWIDIQDLQRLDDHRLLCSGVAYLVNGNRFLGVGGIGIWDEDLRTWVHELPLATTVESGAVLTTNPVWAECDGDEVVLYAAPDDHAATLYSYRLRPVH